MVLNILNSMLCVGLTVEAVFLSGALVLQLMLVRLQVLVTSGDLNHVEP
jgi:hypothetical protein